MVGEVVKEERKRQRLTQAQLAQRAGVKAEFVCRLEKGYGEDPGINKVVRIWRTLGLDDNSLLEKVGPGLPAAA